MKKRDRSFLDTDTDGYLRDEDQHIEFTVHEDEKPTHMRLLGPDGNPIPLPVFKFGFHP